jgi:hypothetical protein
MLCSVVLFGVAGACSDAGSVANPSAAREAGTTGPEAGTRDAGPEVDREAAPPADAATDVAAEATADAGPLSLEFDFETGEQGWTWGFADMPEHDDAGIYELDAGVRPLPAPLPSGRHGLYVHGHNRSDDLFMFVARRLGPADGVLPSRSYRLTLDWDFATQAATGCVGIGGAPGESVFMKVGASSKAAAVATVSGQRVFSLDKGEQSQAGPEATLAGDIASGRPCPDATWVLLTRTVQHTPLVLSTPTGELSVFIGTDSGFEGATSLYYDRVKVTLSPF